MRSFTVYVALLLAVVLCAVSDVSVTSVSGEGNVLDWLSRLPFPANLQPPHSTTYQQVSLGPIQTAPKLADIKPIDPSNPPMPAPAGTVLSDTFRSTPLRRGLFAEREFKNGTEIMKVAFDQMLNYSSPYAPNHPVDPAFNELILQAVHSGAVLDSQALLALRLLLQYQQHHEWKKNAAAAGEKLHWGTFLDDLPKPSSVCFYTQEELAELQIPIESPVFAARSQQLDTITETYLAFDELIKSKPEYGHFFPSGFTEKWFRWAYGIVLNTALEVPIRDEEHIMGALLVLVPVFNQLNHANPPYHNVKFQWNEDPAQIHPKKAPSTDPNAVHPVPQGHGSLSLIAIRDIKQGEELTITYGSLSAIPLLVVNEANSPHAGLHTHDQVETHTSRDKHHNDTNESHFTLESFFQQIGLSNSQLLVHYGIALPTNEFERVALDIGLDSDAVGVEEHHYDILELKRQIIDLNELDHGTLIGIDGKLDPYFIQALRTKHLTPEDLQHLSINEYEFSPEHGYLSLQNELKWQLQLVVSLENLLTAYPTTLQQDMDSLHNLLQVGRPSHQLNLLHSLAYRICLKRILHALILRQLQTIQDLFVNISTGWSEQLHKHNLEEETELKQHLDLTPEAKAALMKEWNAEQAQWFKEMEEWKGEMDKWEATWHQWVQNTMGTGGLLEQVPDHNFHKHVTPETLDEMLDPSIHALQLEHKEEEVTVDVNDETAAAGGHEEHDDGNDDQDDDDDGEGEHDEL